MAGLAGGCLRSLKRFSMKILRIFGVDLDENLNFASSVSSAAGELSAPDSPTGKLRHFAVCVAAAPSGGAWAAALAGSQDFASDLLLNCEAFLTIFGAPAPSF